jgi:flagellar basal-body rod protein FlgC
MSMFGALDAAATGLNVSQTWMDATSDNIANANTIRPAGEDPFRAKMVVAQSLPGMQGAEVTGVQTDQSTAQLVYDPTNQMANKDGYVTEPVVDMSTEMTNMVVASRLYESNLSVVATATQSYQAALSIGKSL